MGQRVNINSHFTVKCNMTSQLNEKTKSNFLITLEGAIAV